MAKSLKLIDYKRLAFAMGYIYLLLTCPTSTETDIEAWECMQCGTIYNKSYRKIKRNGTCRTCIPKSSKPKTLQDYQNVGKIIGIEWTLNTIPKNTDTKTNGFKCGNGHILNKRYKDIRDRIGCAICSGKNLKILEDYQELAKSKGITYILDYSPRGVDIKCENAWKCKEGHIESATYHTIQQSTYACVSCAGNKPKELKNYVVLAEQKEFKFVLDEAPENSIIKIDGWRCKNGHICNRSYHEISQDAGCDKCNQFNSESVCISIFEELLGIKFIKDRPFKNRKLELDGYNKNYKIAVEYNGEHHYKHIKYFHETKELFDKQQQNDKEKQELCKENGILLFVVDYTYNYRNKDKMREHIKELVNNILLIELPIEVYKHFCKNENDFIN